MSRVRVIIITDGDVTAQKAIEKATRELGLYYLEITAGNPTRLSGPEVVNCILQAPCDPVVITVDDKGKRGQGAGEMVVEHVLKCHKIKLMGVVAVASDTRVRGVVVDCSVTAEGRVVQGPVDKSGQEEAAWHHRLEGDTVEIFRQFPNVFKVGCGDIGKIEGRRSVEYGAMIIKKCLQEILKRSETPVV